MYSLKCIARLPFVVQLVYGRANLSNRLQYLLPLCIKIMSRSEATIDDKRLVAKVRSLSACNEVTIYIRGPKRTNCASVWAFLKCLRNAVVCIPAGYSMYM